MEVNVISVTGEERAAIGQKVKQPFYSSLILLYSMPYGMAITNYSSIVPNNLLYKLCAFFPFVATQKAYTITTLYNVFGPILRIQKHLMVITIL